MKTPQQEPLRYVDLAQRGARVERSLGRHELPRWSDVVQGDIGVEVTLVFRRDEASRPCVRGSYRAWSEMLCRRCSEILPHEMMGDFDLTIVSDDAMASALSGARDVVLAERDVLEVAEIVEDELLMAMPEQLCREEACERLLPHDFPVAEEEAAPAAERDNPFAAIAKFRE